MRLTLALFCTWAFACQPEETNACAFYEGTDAPLGLDVYDGATPGSPEVGEDWPLVAGFQGGYMVLPRLHVNAGIAADCAMVTMVAELPTGERRQVEPVRFIEATTDIDTPAFEFFLGSDLGELADQNATFRFVLSTPDFHAERIVEARLIAPL